MTSIPAGLGAALAFAISTLCSAHATRAIGGASTLAWMALVALAVTLPLALVGGVPSGLDPPTLGWLALAGAGNAGGLLLAYRGLRTGSVAILAPIISTEGAIAALIAVAAGQSLGAARCAALAAIVVGIVLAGITRSAQARTSVTAGVPWALAAAVAFGASLYGTARAGDALPVAWAVLPPRVFGVAAVALPLLVSRRLRLAPGIGRLVVTSGLCEVGGFVLYTLGARDDIAVTAVLASLFGALAALLAWFFFKERMARVQIIGVAILVCGVVGLSAISQ